MRNFSANLVAVASIFSSLNQYVKAQLPRECFFVTDMHGPGDIGDLMSDLPTLMAMYKPGMKLDSIIALQDGEDNDVLTGLKVNLNDVRN